jgi:radical SAM superfamily enzyme YgiQ (UPF0313 family)
VKPLIVDTLASGKGVKYSTQDVIGAGPRTVAGVLEKKGLTPTIKMVESYLNDNSPSCYDILLVSGMTNDIRAISRVVRKWRKTGNKPVIIGGPASSDPRRILRKTGGDIAVTGEGEYSLVELLDGGLVDGVIPDNLEKMRGISYKNGEKIEVNPLRPVQPKGVFDEFFPSTSTIIDYRLYKSARVYVEVVRGCSNFHRARIGEIGERCNFCEQCTESSLSERYYCPSGIPPGCGYCSIPSLYGPPKSRTKKLIITEVEKLLELGVHRIVLSAPGFLDYQRESLVEPEPLTDPKHPEPNYEQLENLLHGLSNLPKIKTGKATFMIENLKASLISERAASILGKYLKGTSVSVGFETGSENHGHLLGRPDTPSEILVSLKRLKNVGIKPYVYFIHGLPGQTSKTVNETVDMIGKSVKLGAERIILYRFLSLPASTFTSCPSGPPAAHDPVSRRIYDAAHIANLSIKERLVGDLIKVVVAEKYDRDQSFWVSYPMLHGPVMLLEAENVEEGDVLTATVTGIASDRMVYGVALD